MYGCPAMRNLGFGGVNGISYDPKLNLLYFGVGNGVPDLRASNFLNRDFFYNIVLDGALKDAGMAAFNRALSRDDATAIRNFIIHRANEDSKAAP
jgi:hypothetical protein